MFTLDLGSVVFTIPRFDEGDEGTIGDLSDPHSLYWLTTQIRFKPDSIIDI